MRVRYILIAVVVVFLCAVTALFVGLKAEQAKLDRLTAQVAGRASEALSQALRLSSLLASHQDIIDASRLQPSAKDQFDRLVLQTGFAAIILHNGKTVLHAGYRRGKAGLPPQLPPVSARVSRKFVASPEGGWMFEITQPVRVPNGPAVLTVYLPFEDQAQFWRALPERMRLLGAKGETLYAHDRGFFWSPLVSNQSIMRHDMELTLARSPQVLLGYVYGGAMTGILFAAFGGIVLLSVQHRRSLAEARLEALSGEAERLEALVQARTKALRDSQDQLLRAAKFKVLNEMASGLAHEFSQPLFALTARLDALGEQVQTCDSQESVAKAQKLLDRMGQVLNNLKLYIRNDEQELVAVDLSRQVTASIDLLEHALQGKAAVVHHEVPDPPPFAEASATRLVQVFVNILGNAVDAIDEGGEICVSYGAGPCIMIEDSGGGFPDLQSPLEPFVTTKQDQNGLGLGLSISRDIMQSFGGRLLIDHADGGGAKVTLMFKPQERNTG